MSVLTTTNADKAAVGLSLVCVVHCLLTPIAIIMLPALGTTFLENESFHFGILFLVIPTSVYALGLGCRQHGRKQVLAIGLFGLLVLCAILVVGEETLGEIGETVSTIVGASIVALAHVRNYSLCRKQECADHSDKP